MAAVARSYASLRAAASAIELAPSSAYIHIPFCRRRCHYCDFTIVAIGERSSQQQQQIDSTMATYTDHVCMEILASKAFPGRLNTVFFGGGTPSLLPTRLLRRIIETLQSKHGIAPGAEISMEMDPGTFDSSYLDEALDCGISRVSLGVQSFDDGLLKLCGRSHDVHQAYEAIEMLRSKLSNWSLDLISSLPHQSIDQWCRSLVECISASPVHVSIYDLQLEQGTRFGKLYKQGQSPLPSDDESAEFYRLASSILRDAGYEHYEISNYAKPGFRCDHNLVYWRNRPYYAYGLGSTSYVEGRRFSRSKSMREYKKFVQDLELNSGGYGQAQEAVPPWSEEERLLDTVMLSLRLADGIELDEFEREFGAEARKELCDGLREFVVSGYVVPLGPDREPLLVNQEDWTLRASFVRLSDPDGFMLSNEIISSLFTDLSRKT